MLPGRVHVGAVPNGDYNYPYVLLWAGVGQPDSETTLATGDDLEDWLGVTCVDTTPVNAISLAARTRQLLDRSHPPVPGRNVTLTFVESRPVALDEHVTLPATGGHPAFVVLRYHLTSTPVKGT
jgi:hypothetical protein